ncbi:MAG TPA: hypothetical protein VKP88_02560 [Candidatus Paceibacterota bacterium]|nr:hypothetical protein [Candidatus Paceibacterota bacterium]
MAMQYDVKAAERATSGSIYGDATRVKGLVVSFASGGTVVLKDGGASGTTRFSYTAPASAGTTNILIPGEGIRFSTDVYATLSDATVTVFYG